MLEEIRPPRRAVIAGVGLAAVATAVAACSSDTKTPASSEAASSASPGAGSSGTSGAPGSGALAKTADVPVGSGVIRGDVVLTQPTAGVFKGFSSVCPHRGCNVDAITDGKIICPCHNSEFNLDGSVAKGPATKPLETKTVAVQGDSIVAG